MAARRAGEADAAAEGGEDECCCGFYDCEDYSCEFYGNEYCEEVELESFARQFLLGEGEEESSTPRSAENTVDGINNAFACNEEDPDCIPEGEEG